MISNQISIVAQVKNGKAQFSDQDLQYIGHFMKKREGKAIRVIFAPAHKQRSINQSNYYWGVVLKTIEEFTGQDSDDLHEFFKSCYSIEKVVNLAGNDFVVPQSTAKMNTLQFTEYIEKVRKWAAEELSLSIPDPNQVDF